MVKSATKKASRVAKSAIGKPKIVKCSGFRHCKKPATILENTCESCDRTEFCEDCVTYYTKAGCEKDFLCAACFDGIGYYKFYFEINGESECDCGQRLVKCMENHFECGSVNNALRKK